MSDILSHLSESRTMLAAAALIAFVAFWIGRKIPPNRWTWTLRADPVGTVHVLLLRKAGERLMTATCLEAFQLHWLVFGSSEEAMAKVTQALRGTPNLEDLILSGEPTSLRGVVKTLNPGARLVHHETRLLDLERGSAVQRVTFIEVETT